MTLAEILKNYEEGQEIFRRPSVTLLIERIKELEELAYPMQVTTTTPPLDDSPSVLSQETNGK